MDPRSLVGGLCDDRQSPLSLIGDIVHFSNSRLGAELSHSPAARMRFAVVRVRVQRRQRGRWRQTWGARRISRVISYLSLVEKDASARYCAMETIRPRHDAALPIPAPWRQLRAKISHRSSRPPLESLTSLVEGRVFQGQRSRGSHFAPTPDQLHLTLVVRRLPGGRRQSLSAEVRSTNPTRSGPS